MYVSAQLLRAPAHTLRAHPEGGERDPYQLVCTAEINGDTAWISAAAGEFSPAVRRAMADTLRSLGVVHAEWERRKNGLFLPRQTSK